MYGRLPVVLYILFAGMSGISGYSLTWKYTGADFINNFDFWDDAVTNDPTGSSSAPSAAWYMPRGAAQQQGLAWVNGKGHFGLSVDSTFKYSGNNKRPSARITSKTSIRHGLLILDAVHLPYGTGTWPAFWLVGADGNWPNSGEIDIYEGVHNNVQNTVSFHTASGCSYDTSASQTGILNTAVGTDCDALKNNDEACGNVDPSTTSYGSGTTNVGGGIYALEWTPNVIKIWHFNRNSAPDNVQSLNPSPSSWGTPVATLTKGRCNLDGHFGPQKIVFDIELCGTWAGNVYSGGPQACFNFVQQNPNVFKTAYFEIVSLKYFQ